MKRFALLLLVFCAALVAVPGWAETTVSNIQQLKDALNNTSVMEIIATQTIQINDDVTLNGNGHTLSLAQSATGSVIKITKGNVTINDLTITGGNADGDSGGGIYVYDAHAVVNNCVFDQNQAGVNGGGIYVVTGTQDGSNNASATITNCTFTGNTANGSEGGGGVFADDHTTVNITNCTFAGNTYSNDNKGGGLCVGVVTGSGGANVTVNYCTFATDSDGIHINNQNKLTVKNSIIRKTITTANGASASNVTTENNLTITTKLTPDTVKDATDRVTHTVFRKHAELSAAIDGGDTSVTVDQLGNSRGNKPDLGAVEIEAQSGGDTPLTVATPIFNPAAGTYTGAQTVTISCKTEGATIYYTTDGSTPTANSAKYTGAISVSKTTTVKAIAVKDGVESSVATATYTINSGGSGSGSSGSNTPVTPDSGSTGGGSGGGGSGGGGSGGVSVTGVDVTLTLERSWKTVQQGLTGPVSFKANALAKYSDGTEKTLTPKLSLVDEDKYPWITINISKGIVQLSPGTDVKAGDYKVTVKATASEGGKTDTATATLTVTVEEGLDFFIFDKSTIILAGEPGGTAEESVNVSIRGEKKSDYQIECRKTEGPDWVTASVDGWKITFRATPPANQTADETCVFEVLARPHGDREMLRVPYKVVAEFLKLKGCQLTIAPAEVAVLAGATGSVDLKDSVRFEKVYENGKRRAVEAKMTFSPQSKQDWMTLDPSGVVTVKPGADVKTGEYFCDYSVVADDNGQTETGTGRLTVNIEPGEKPAITTETLPYAALDTTYSAQMAARGLTPITWTYGGTLPTGLTFDKTGKLSGVPTEAGTFKFTVEAKNAIGSASRTVQLMVRDQKPSNWKFSHDSKATNVSGNWTVTFHVEKGTNVVYADKGISTNILNDSLLFNPYVKEIVVNNKPGAGEGYIRYGMWKCANVGNANNTTEYLFNFKVQASNSVDKSTFTKSIKVEKTRDIVSTGSVSTAGDIDGGSDGETPDSSNAPGSTVTYFHNGSVDEEGNITAVIGKAADGVEDSPYRFDSVESIPTDSRDKVVSIEFREVEKVDAEGLKNLSDLSIYGCNVTFLDLSGMEKLERLSLYGCDGQDALAPAGSLTALNVSGCKNLSSLSVLECPALETLNVSGDNALEFVELNDTAIEALDLSGRTKLAALNLNGCTSLDVLNVSGCTALTDVSLNGAAIPYLDLSGAAGLKSLSLADVSELAVLSLPDGAAFDSFTLTGSRVALLTLNGTEKLTTLDLSGNVSMDKLALSGCSALSELDVSGCGFEILDLSGCTSLEKLNANECAAMTTLTLPGSGAQDVSVSDSATAGKLKELSVGGCAELRSLNVSGQSLGHLELDGLKWLTSVECDGQFIGGRTMSENMDLKDYAGNCLYRVSDVQGYAADGSPVETSWNKDTGEMTFASVPADMSYSYDTGLDGCVLGVTVSTANTPDNSDSPTSNRGGGGCDALSGGLLALGALGLVARKRK